MSSEEKQTLQQHAEMIKDLKISVEQLTVLANEIKKITEQRLQDLTKSLSVLTKYMEADQNAKKRLAVEEEEEEEEASEEEEEREVE